MKDRNKKKVKNITLSHFSRKIHSCGNLGKKTAVSKGPYYKKPLNLGVNRCNLGFMEDVTEKQEPKQCSQEIELI